MNVNNPDALKIVHQRTLLVVGSNPPVSSGKRTIQRAELASRILGFDDCDLENIFSAPTHRTGDISAVGEISLPWLEARPILMGALDRASAVLLAYGLSKPAGVAAKYHVEQVTWLKNEIDQRGLAVWCVGGEPRHPSRWQRYTYRAYPDMAFPEALRASLAVQGLG